MIIDILDTSGSFLGRVRNLIGGNPIIIVATKVDLLPKGTSYNHVHEWLDDFVAFKKLNCLSVHLVSNKTGTAQLAPCLAALC
jgi:nitric-oxide synthase, plant